MSTKKEMNDSTIPNSSRQPLIKTTIHDLREKESYPFLETSQMEDVSTMMYNDARLESER